MIDIYLEIYELSVHIVLDVSEVNANLYCNFAHLYWEGCVICSIYLRYLMGHPVEQDHFSPIDIIKMIKLLGHAV